MISRAVEIEVMNHLIFGVGLTNTFVFACFSLGVFAFSFCYMVLTQQLRELRKHTVLLEDLIALRKSRKEAGFV
jgi:hypothetical protein